LRFTTFTELTDAVDKLIEQNKYTEALGILDTNIKVLAHGEADKYQFQAAWLFAMLYSNVKKYDECIKVIRNIVKKGSPFPLSFKRFEPLKDMPGYKELYDINNDLLGKAKANATMEYEVRLPENYDPNKKYPLFLALHGHGICNIKEFSTGWRPDVFIRRGFIFAYLQSSQILCYEGYGWLDDLDKANEDIKKCIDSITSEYPVDKSPVFIGGYSGGAIASVNFALSGLVPVEGLIALCPEIKPPAFTNENVREAVKRGLKCVFMEG